ncbi:bifunctional ADP-dependent NAD(P)H-hydrate dehydratase/NAD(P)H-hydrate epimerase [Gorillibacterium timonense]|uniref:bifunctional ADP-dependent NAD(P)H-hydrate dehydratase/NAD(P)H-hydrate epimerase n=1 Tax=Gorillibacterium timonense TaxID=1689269 RepID=UPI00071E5E47|nr:bifunctional ADP-dependent NAD(P)H-hydrate dehydratase/NAD(P)H-hydrate epimerase [Gorillibacterium timonense]
MYVLTAEQMKQADRHTIDQIGIPAMCLMENAGRALADEIIAFSERLEGEGRKLKRRWIVLAGKGNNGGDGLVAARHLRLAGMRADILFAFPEGELAGEAALQRDIAARCGLSLSAASETDIRWDRYDGIVDALLGTGSTGAPRGTVADLIRTANDSGLPIVAADLPSGLDADTGAVHDPCIRAEATVAFAYLKQGLVLHPGADYAGRVVVRPIGIPEEALEGLTPIARLITPETLEGVLGVDVTRKRREDTHKGTYGHALIAAGTQRMSGAGLLATRAALRTGCGLATWAMPSSLVRHLLGRLPEAMLAGVPDAGDGDWTHVSAETLLKLAEGKSAFAMGPGLGRYADDSQWLRAIWEGVRCPLVLDADALGMLADASDFADWRRRDEPTILTPHPGEMGRLLGIPTADVQADRIGVAREYAARHGVTLVLKGSRTVVASPDGDVYLNPTGNPGMSTGGTGDALTGVITSLLAQGLSSLQAACFGVWLHGKAGDDARASRGTETLLAGDLIECL